MNEINKEIKDIVENLTSFDKMYQKIRVIDPINKKVINYKGNLQTTEACYGIFAKSENRVNFISMRAYNENDTFVKIEFAQDKIFLVTSIPVETSNTKIVVELLKDITNSMVSNDADFKNSIELKNLLHKANLATVTDGLTNVYNKRYIIEKLPVEITTHHLNKKQLSILMVDIDFFKEINDMHGHIAGDYILKEFTLLLKNCIRQDKDWIARFGGEEFLICLPDTQSEVALTIAERIRKTVEKETFIFNNLEIKLTTSLGVFTVNDQEIREYEEVIGLADKNLYKAKQRGRNCVVG